MEDLSAFGILVGVPLVVAWFVLRLSQEWLRRKVAESGASPEAIRALYERHESPRRYTALKWGMVAVGLGLGASFETFLPYDFDDSVSFGVLLLCGGGALILYYFYVGRHIPSGSGTSGVRPRPAPEEDTAPTPRGDEPA